MVSFGDCAVSDMTLLRSIAVSFFQFFFFFHVLLSSGVTSYSPVDNFAVTCGSSGNSSDVIKNRTWTGDIISQLFSLTEPRNDHHSSLTADTTGSQKLPYRTVRLSRSEFSYSFPVTAGQKFIRLHFYPSSYLDFQRSDSYFTVKAGKHILLKDFNASLNADYAIQETFVREFSINVDLGQNLNVTFTPNSSHPNAYAFINGIEVVSMPDYLYYTKPNDLQSMKLDDSIKPFPVENRSALETLYRINVGGSQIPTEQDTGMFRYWYDDVQYVEIERSHSVSAGYGLRPIYKDGNQNYFAPDSVYMTARNYGMNQTSEYNVTWHFEVDSEFTYMIRLHFCEFDDKIRTTGGRVFQIFIADKKVEPFADVYLWSGNNLNVPVHKDYAVSMWSHGSFKKKMNLSIKLQPHPTARSIYRDVLLNGIEILKISDYSGNLAGPNPDPRPSTSIPATPSHKSSSNKTRLISITVGIVSGIIAISLIILLIVRRLTRGPVIECNSWWGLKSAKSSENDKSHNGSTLPSDLCRCFSIAEIRAATNNFDNIFIVGLGGFGNVYKGYIDNGTAPVAIKRLKQGSKQGLREFQTEIEMLTQLRHNHLVSLIGYCNDGNEMILVYEFMARGTLRDHLYNSDNPPLPWKQRMEMCLGAARGLHYLHTGANHTIIHRDVKTSNILIDEKWMAKVSDFGLSKIGPTGVSKSYISTVVKGSFGYLDPEYYKRQRLTEKSDVYSFGVVLLEVLCGRPPLLRNVGDKKLSLVEWVRKSHRKGLIHQTVDPFLVESIKPRCLKAFSEMALKCLMDNGNERPSMNDVVWGLEFALQLQEGTEDEEAEIEGTSEERALLIINETKVVEDSKLVFTSSDESKGSMLTNTSSSEGQFIVSGISIFSELDDPTVR